MALTTSAAVDELQSRDMRRCGERGFDRLGVADNDNRARRCPAHRRRAAARRRARRLPREVTTGSGSMSIATASAASFACATRLGDDAGDRIADIAHFVRRQRGAPRLLHRRAVAVVQRHDAFERAVAFQIGAGIDAEHARHFPRRLGVDGADDAVGVAAAHHHRIGLAGQADVVGIMSLAAQQHRVFAARHRLADGKFLDRQSVLGRQFVRPVVGGLLQIHDDSIL